MEDFVTVAIYDSLPVAEIARLHLTDAGIQAFLSDSNLVAAHALLSFAVGGIKLCVSRSDLARAEAILAEIKFDRGAAGSSDSDAPIRFTCSECGTALEFPSSRRGGVETCTKCGEYVDVPECTEPGLLSTDGLPSNSLVLEQPLASTSSARVATSVTRRIPLPLEIAAVLSFVYLPNVAYSLLAVEGQAYDLMTSMTYLLVGAVETTIPLLLIITLCGEGWEKFGLVPFRWLLDCSLAFAIWFVDRLVLSLVYLPLVYATQSNEASIASWQSGLVCLLSLTANSVAEEIAMRGYLITRLEELWHSRWLAVTVSAAIFTSYHAHEGLWGMVSIAIGGLIYGAFYVWQRRLWPLIIAHTAYNLVLYL